MNPYEPPVESGAARASIHWRGMRRLAKLSYGLACLGPFAMWVMALCYPPTDHRLLPALPVQILWWALCISPFVGTVLGAVVLILFRTGTLGARRMGATYAVAGVVVGIMSSLLLLSGIPMLTGIRHQNHNGSHPSCSSNLRQLTLGVRMYMQDYDEYMPLATTWNDAIWPYTKSTSLFVCPEGPESLESESLPTYAMNIRLSGVADSTIATPDQTVLLFDSIPGKNLAGGMELLPNPLYHQGNQPIAFPDGNVKAIPADQLAALFRTPLLEPKAKSSQGKNTQDAPPKKR